MNNWEELTNYLNKILEEEKTNYNRSSSVIEHYVGPYGNAKKNNGVKVEIYSEEHSPPHFHVSYDGYKCCYKIEKTGSLEILKGTMDRKVNKKITDLYENHDLRKKAIKVWNDTRPDDCPVGFIK